jgi:hypothetical protein
VLFCGKVFLSFATAASLETFLKQCMKTDLGNESETKQKQ